MGLFKALGAVGGAIAGAFVGAPAQGAALGSKIGGAVDASREAKPGGDAVSQGGARTISVAGNTPTPYMGPGSAEWGPRTRMRRGQF